MTPADAEAHPPSDALPAAGWQQGSLFGARPLRYLWNDLPEPGKKEPSVKWRQARSREKAVVISQTCDIASADEPYVEAMLCSEVQADFAARIDRNSARHFLVDPATGLVAQAKYRLQLSKALLVGLQPESWPATPGRLDRFVRWLARRYDRPALPDALVDVFQNPIEDALRQLDMDQPEVVGAFNGIVREIRVSVPEREAPPFVVRVTLLLNDSRLTAEQDDAIEQVVAAMQRALDPMKVSIIGRPNRAAEADLSVAEYFATRPLFLEYLTYRGDVVEGAPPPHGG